ncbi:hypothetical protein [Streptomyces wuyuanensis]|uniref:hypothetical protein n=1 Tax=Streptomyces wuyuanensis TaxID=1196353 RepID=UPI00378C01A2
MTILRFEKSAPMVPSSSEDRAEVAAALKATPGTWALLGQRKVPGSARQDAYSVRLGLHGWAMFGPGYEAEARTLFGEHRIYVRYVGGAR